jgi:hypothetical protein
MPSKNFTSTTAPPPQTQMNAEERDNIAVSVCEQKTNRIRCEMILCFTETISTIQ